MLRSCSNRYRLRRWRKSKCYSRVLDVRPLIMVLRMSPVVQEEL